MSLPVKVVRKRSEKAWETKEQWRDLLEQAYMYASPQRNLYNQHTEGAKKNSHLFDSTLLVSTRKSANKFVNLMFPAFQQWVKIEAGPKWNDQKDFKNKLNKQLQDITEKMFSIIHHRSNFQSAIGEMALDMMISNGVITTQKGNIREPVNYQAVPQIEAAFERGAFGQISGVYRKFELPISVIEATWSDAKLSKEMLDAKANDETKKYKLIEALYTNYDDGKICYDVIVDDGGPRIVERELRRNPYIVGSLTRAANEVHGRGFVLDALPDAKTLNKLVELTLKNASLAVSGVFTVVDDGVVNPDTIQLSPLSFIPVARNSGHPSGASIEPLGRSGDFDVANLEQARLQDSIKKVMLDNELPPMTGQPRTAQEIIQRIRMFADDLGATYGRVVREVVTPIVANTLDILDHDWGIIQMPTDPSGRKLTVDGENLTLTITSPLAQQQNLSEVEIIVQAIEISRSLFGPQATALNFEMEKIPAEIARKLGVDEDLIRENVDKEKLQVDVAGAIANIEGNSPGAGLGLVNEALAQR